MAIAFKIYSTNIAVLSQARQCNSTVLLPQASVISQARWLIISTSSAPHFSHFKRNPITTFRFIPQFSTRLIMNYLQRINLYSLSAMLYMLFIMVVDDCESQLLLQYEPLQFALHDLNPLLYGLLLSYDHNYGHLNSFL